MQIKQKGTEKGKEKKVEKTSRKIMLKWSLKCPCWLNIAITYTCICKWSILVYMYAPRPPPDPGGRPHSSPLRQRHTWRHGEDGRRGSDTCTRCPSEPINLHTPGGVATPPWRKGPVGKGAPYGRTPIERAKGELHTRRDIENVSIDIVP